MARFFFDLHDGTDLFRDEEGTELPGPGPGRHEAMDALLDVMRRLAPDHDRARVMVRMRDEHGRVLFDARLSLVVRQLG